MSFGRSNAMRATNPVSAAASSLVVVIDDQATGRKILEKLIRGIDPTLRVLVFDDPILALDAIRRATPDLVVTDYLMPQMNGVRFIRELHSLPDCADVPVVVITVVEDRNIRYEALDAGASDFLNRPIDEYECRARCRNLLMLRHQQQVIHNQVSELEHQVALATQAVRDRELETLIRLAKAVEYRDEGTGNHVLRIAEYSRLVAEALGQNAEFCDDIEHAAPMHDIGKVGIPDRILLKPGRLTEQEFEIMRQHSRIGYEILKGSPSRYLRLGASIARYHHERFDGSGYPEGVHGEAIPIEARIVALVDVFDALTTERPYKNAWTIGKTLDFLTECSGSHFDPACVRAFFERLDEVRLVRRRLRDAPRHERVGPHPIGQRVESGPPKPALQ